MTTVFFDRTCGRNLPQALRLLGLPVEGHADHFAHNTADDVWLASVAARGWVVVTNDKNVRFRQNERQAIIEHGVGCFVFTSGNRTRWQMAQILAKAWDRIQAVSATAQRPFIYSIHADGAVEPLYPARSP